MDYFDEPNNNSTSPLGVCLCSACWGSCANSYKADCKGTCSGCNGGEGKYMVN